jgi:alcohol dehydrogenase YqhD (iron-dependent ADH family)
VYEQAIDSLRAYDIEFVEFWGVKANPILSHALAAVKVCRDENVEGILALGGGSVIDEAKSIAAGFYLEDLWAAFEGNAEIHNALPVFSVLTLSGTCSEMDPYAVLTDEESNKKWNIDSELLYPTSSIIDPVIQMSLPWHQTVNGAIDAISHTQEFYFLGSDQEISLSICESILNTVTSCVDTLKIDSMNYPARASLAWSATLALNGIAGASLKGGDWAVHRIEHGISGLFPDVAHGAGLAVLYPAWIQYCYELNEGHFRRWAQNVWGTDQISQAIEMMKEKFKSWGAPVSLSELGIREQDIRPIAENALLRGKIGKLKVLDVPEVMEILKIAY